MSEQTAQRPDGGVGSVAGEVSERGQAEGGCCGPSAVAVDSGSAQQAAPCCGTAAEASAQGSCCGTAAKAEAVASGASCCG